MWRWFLLFACVSTSWAADPPFYADKTRLLVWKDDQGREQPVKTPAEWQKRRAHILANMQLVMGPLPDDSNKVPLDVRTLEVVMSDQGQRRKISFAVEKNDRVNAYLFIPAGLKGKTAGILCLHQTTAIGKDEPAGLGGNPNLHYAKHLAERGFVTLAPDYPSFGEYKYDFARRAFKSGSMKAIWNNLRAVDLLQSLPEVDEKRIGCIGHSLGGHNTMFTMALDERIKAGVSNCGFTSFPKYYKGNLKGWTSARYMPRIDSVYENNPAKMPFDFTEVVASFAPRAFLASSPVGDDNFEVSGVKDCLTAARPVFELLGAKEQLQANYPNCRHDFPMDVRTLAYDFLARSLK